MTKNLLVFDFFEAKNSKIQRFALFLVFVFFFGREKDFKLKVD